jgi:hypothetical protein
MSTPSLNDAFVRSKLTRKIAALEASTRRNPSQSQVSKLNNLTRIYHGILATPKMQPETALDVLSECSSTLRMALQAKMDLQQKLLQTLSNVMRKSHDTSSSIIQNMK